MHRSDEQFFVDKNEELRGWRHELVRREHDILSRESKRGVTRRGLAVGDRVKTTHFLKFRSGKTAPAGTVGVVTKVPGDTPVSVAEVHLIETGVLFDPTDTEIEPLINSLDVYEPPEVPDSPPSPTSTSNASNGWQRDEVTALRHQLHELSRENTLLKQHFRKVQEEGETRQRESARKEPVYDHKCCDEQHTPYCKRTGFKHTDRPVKGNEIPNSAKALIVSVSYRGTPETLSGSVEAGHTAKSFLQRSGFAGDVIHLTEEEVPKSPTRANILRCLNWLVKDTRPGECVYFHFIGRSILAEDYKGLRNDQRVPFQGIAPVDVHQEGYVYVDEMLKIFQLLPKGSKITVVIDTEPCGVSLPLQYKFTEVEGELISSGCMGLDASVICVAAEHSNPAHSRTLTPPSRGPSETQNGALTTAFTTTLSMLYRPTTASLLEGIRSFFTQFSIPYTPVVTSSTPFLMDDVFKLGILTKIEDQRRLRNWNAKLQAVQSDVPSQHI